MRVLKLFPIRRLLYLQFVDKSRRIIKANPCEHNDRLNLENPLIKTAGETKNLISVDCDALGEPEHKVGTNKNRENIKECETTGTRFMREACQLVLVSLEQQHDLIGW